MSSLALAFRGIHSPQNTKEQGQTELDRKSAIAVATIHADLLMLSQVMPRRFNSKTTEADAFQKLVKFVREAWENDDSLSPEQAILQVVEKYQTPFYPDIASIHKRTEEIRREENARATALASQRNGHRRLTL